MLTRTSTGQGGGRQAFGSAGESSTRQGPGSGVPGAGRESRLCLQIHPPHNSSATAIPTVMTPPKFEIWLFDIRLSLARGHQP